MAARQAPGRPRKAQPGLKSKPHTYQRVNKLPAGLPCAPNGQSRARFCRRTERASIGIIPPKNKKNNPKNAPKLLTFGQVHLVDEPRQHVAVLDVEVVVGPEDVGGDDGGEAAAVLLEITPGRGECGVRGLVVPSHKAILGVFPGLARRIPLKSPWQLWLPSSGVSPAPLSSPGGFPCPDIL